MDLEFIIKNQSLYLNSSDEGIVNLSENYLNLNFTFETTDWSDLTKFALFKHDGLTTRIAIINDSITVPSTLLVKNKVVFSVYGVTEMDGEEYRITTNLVRFDLLNSGFTKDTDNPLPPDQPDLVEQIFIAISEKVDIITFNETVNGLNSDIGLKADKSYVDTELEVKSNVGHKHNKSDITDFSHNHDERYYTESEIDGLLLDKSDVGHTHTKSDITDFNHNHDDRYYTETEVDAIVSDLENRLNNKIKLDADKMIIQSNDTVEFRAFLMKDGMPVKNATIEFYKGSDD